MTVAAILRDLVAIATPSAKSNLPLIEWCWAFLKRQGWQVHFFPYIDEAGVAKANLIARPRAMPIDAPIGLAFVCHSDTVPFAADWTDALDLQSKDGGTTLSGCGACDVKGSLACFLAAVAEVATEHVRPDGALIVTADEEMGCKGMDRLLETTKLVIGSAIVSEPTSLRPGIAGKGYGLARVTVRGAEAHSAYPAEGVSAIALAAKFIASLPVERETGVSAEDRLFDPPATTLNVGVIQGGTAKNIIAGACSFLVEWRPLPSDAPARVLEQLRSQAYAFTQAHPRAQIEVQALRAETGFAPSNEGPLQRAIAEAARAAGVSASREVTGISFGSEAGRLSRVANEIIIIGPGDMHTAHSSRECVPVAELHEWTETLRGLLASPEFMSRFSA